MFQIALCEPNPAEAARLYAMLMRYRGQNLTKNIKVRIFSRAEQLLEEFSSGGLFDVYLIDTALPGIDCVMTANAIRGTHPHAVVLLLGGTPRRAGESDLACAGHIHISPVECGTLFAALDRVVDVPQLEPL